MSNEIQVLNHGYVALAATMGDDRTPARCARTSYRNAGAKRSEAEDAKLTKYLITHHHSTPLEFCQALFYMKMPIFVARQLVRHRTASINEVSYRYIRAVREFYIPDYERMNRQSTTNKQGSSSDIVDRPEVVHQVIVDSCNGSFDAYEKLLAEGLAAELSRTVLPLGTYTEWYWQANLRNILHLLELRLDGHAQYEIRVYAQAMLDLLRPIYPTIIEAWEAR